MAVAEDQVKLKAQKLSLEHSLTGFDCGEDDMTDFLVEDAFPHQEMRMSTTYVFVESDTSVVIGYVTLCCDSLRLTEDERAEEEITCGFPVPAIKIARLGVGKERQKRGFGSTILDFGLGLASTMSEHVGCRFVTVDALPHRVGWYQSREFEINAYYKSKQKTASLRFDLLRSRTPIGKAE